MIETITLTFQVPDPLPASPDPTDPSTERVSEFPSRQTPRQGISSKVYCLKNTKSKTPHQATLPEPTPAVPGKPITATPQVFFFRIFNNTTTISVFNFFFSQESIIPDEMAKLLQQNPNIAQVKFV